MLTTTSTDTRARSLAHLLAGDDGIVYPYDAIRATPLGSSPLRALPDPEGKGRFQGRPPTTSVRALARLQDVVDRILDLGAAEEVELFGLVRLHPPHAPSTREVPAMRVILLRVREADGGTRWVAFEVERL